MHKQARKYWCGPAALQNALEALGHRVTQKAVAELCGTTKDGTTEHLLAEGLDGLGYKAEHLSTDVRFSAKQLITTHLRFGEPVLLCVDDWGHWVSLVTPPLGDRFAMVDPLKGTIELIHWKRLERRWRTAARLQTGPRDRTYYALAIGREP